MHEHGDENDPAQPFRNDEAGCDGNAVEEGVDQQSQQDRIAFVGVDELMRVGLFAKMKVRGDGVLEEVNQKVSQQNQESGPGAAQVNAFGHHLHDGSREHEAGAERDEIAQIGAVPIFLNNDGAAENVCARCGEPKQHTRQNG